MVLLYHKTIDWFKNATRGKSKNSKKKIIRSFLGGPFLKCLILSKNGIMIE